MNYPPCPAIHSVRAILSPISGDNKENKRRGKDILGLQSGTQFL